jgi:NAD(P)-dependent dehydrogenase (short-subunit alcohol dehydrogenase family)
MKAPFCIIGATRGTGLLIAQQLLERGSNVKVVVRDPGKASDFSHELKEKFFRIASRHPRTGSAPSRRSGFRIAFFLGRCQLF